MACGGARPVPPVPPGPVILLVGDGMGDAEVTAARNYQVGAAGRLALDRLPHQGRVTTFAVQESNPHRPDYVVDSAASATAWATGSKTSNYRLSTAAGTDEILPTILERAQHHGLPVGSVTTAELTDATPAALVAHVNSRRCQGPADMDRCARYRRSRGGPGSIAEQSVDRRVDVLLGGGRERFEQSLEGQPGRTVLDVARERGDQVVFTASELASITADRPLLGLFAAADLEPEWSGEPALPYPGSGPQVCRENAPHESQPDLVTMAKKALALLSARARNSRGVFFLQIEAANVDKCAHDANPCGQIGATVMLDAALEAVLEWADEHPEALVIVTADHAHATQIVPPPSAGARAPGLLSTLITRERAQMTLNYATTMAGAWQTHTGTTVPIAARGPGAEKVTGLLDQTHLHDLFVQQLGIRD